MATKKTNLVFSSISALNSGTRDVAVDCTDALETSETVNAIEVTSSDVNVLTATGAIANAAVITKENGDTIAIEKGFQFQIATQDTSVKKRDIILDAKMTGNSGTLETYEILVPVVDKKRA